MSLKRFLELMVTASYVRQVERKGMLSQGEGIAWKYERPRVSRKQASRSSRGVRSLRVSLAVTEGHWKGW